MKKVCLLFLLFFCGCSNKSGLKCSISNDVDLYNNSVSIILDDSSIKINEEFVIKDDFKELLDVNTLFESIFNSFSSLDKSGIKIDSNKKDNSFIIDINIDKVIIDDSAKESITNLFGIDVDKSINEIKSSLEKNGYICN